MSEEGLTHLGFRLYRYNANAVADSTVSWFTDVNFEETFQGQGTNDSPTIIPSSATLGEIYRYNYRSFSTAELTGETLTLFFG